MTTNQPVRQEVTPVAPPAKTHSWLLPSLFLLILIAAAWYFWTRRAPPTAYLTAPVDRGDIEATIRATGNCNAVVTVQVGSQVSGNIQALYADFNTKVKKDQLVAQIDPAVFQARVDQAKANLDSARMAVITARANLKKVEADIANAQANVVSQQANEVRAQSAVTDAQDKNNRRIRLMKEGVLSAEDAGTAQATYDQAVAALNTAHAVLHAAEAALESTKAQREVAQAQLAGAEALVKVQEAALAQAQLDLSHTRILAPVDGTVVSRNMDVGQTVAASFQAPTIFLIAQDLTKMQVDTNLDEADVGPIRVGQQAYFTVDAYPGTTFPGSVTQIRQAPINVQNVITYDVVVGVANPDLLLFPGMTANVRIVTGRAEAALRVPAAALRFRPTSESKARTTPGARQPRTPAPQVLYVLQAGNAKPVPVRLGLSDGNFVQVLSGLEEGQFVITGTPAKTSGAKSAASPSTGGRPVRF